MVSHAWVFQGFASLRNLQNTSLEKPWEAIPSRLSCASRARACEGDKTLKTMPAKPSTQPGCSSANQVQQNGLCLFIVHPFLIGQVAKHRDGFRLGFGADAGQAAEHEGLTGASLGRAIP